MPDEKSDVFDIFREEATEQLQQIHRGLLALRAQTGDEALLQEAARAADVMMGSALTVDQGEIGKNATTIRDLLTRARKGDLSLDESEFALLFQSLEEIAASLDQAPGQRPGVPQVAILRARECADLLYHGILQLEVDVGDSKDSSSLGGVAGTLTETCDRDGLGGAHQIAERIDRVVCAAEGGRLQVDRPFVGQLLQGLGFIEILLDAAANGRESGVEVDELCEFLYGDLPFVNAATDRAVAVPVNPSTSAGESGEKQPAGLITEEHGTPRKKVVLIASNSSLFNQALLEVMAPKDLEVLLVSDASELMSHIENGDIDICFLRDSLPDALAVCERASNSRTVGADIPIIVYSPMTRMEKIALEKGASGFLKVPCEPKEVMALINRWLEPGPTPPRSLL